MENVGHIERESHLGASWTPRGMRLFMLLWSGQTISQLGTGLLGFALGVMVYQQTGSVTRFALIGLSATVPGLLLSPLAGVLADRWDRRRLLILSNVGAAVANLVLFGLFRTGRLELWQIYPVVVASACCMAFVWPAFSAATTVIVGKQHFARASGLNQLGASLSQILAPALAGVLLASIGASGIVLINLASYLVAAAVLLLVRFPPATASAEGEAATGTVRQQTRYAWGFIHQRPGLRWLLLLFAGVNFSVGMLTVLLTPLVLTFASPATLGVVLTIASSGMLVGGILMSVWGGPQRRVMTILTVVPIMGLLMLCAGLRPSATLVAAVSFLFLLGFPIITGAGQAIWQSKVPPDLQGRVFAVQRMISGLAMPAAFVIAGPLADRLFEPAMAVSGSLAASVGPLIGVGPGRGIALMIMGLGGLTLLIAIAGWCSSALRRVETDLEDAVADESSSIADHSPPKRRQTESNSGLQGLHAAVCLLVMLATAAIAILAQRPPSVLGAGEPATVFSADRAQPHVSVLAAMPHPVGSAAQHRARDYLIAETSALGFEVAVQRTPDVNVFEAIDVTHLVTVENVVARLPGTAGRRGSVLLVAHYDSAPTAPGASDNGAAVAALLETARALSESKPLANDVILLFSDGEEAGLNGARAFIKSHPWAPDVAAVLNFDARGHRGPVYMFQTGHNNHWWLPHLAAAPRPLGSSLMSSIYRLLPNETDFTLFQQAGYAGFNFAAIEGLTHYHTLLDRPEDLDLRTLQHQGSTALALTRHLGDLDLSDIRRGQAPEAGDRAYFNLLGGWMVHYPAAFGVVLAIFACGTLLALLGLGLRRGQLSLFGLGQGFLAHLGALVAIPVVITVVWLVVRDVAGIPILMGSTPGAGRYMLAFAVLTLALVAGWQRFLGKLVSELDLTAGALVWWLLLTIVTSGWWLPVATNFIFLWPLLFALPVFGYLLFTPATARRPWKTVTILTLCALPAILLWAPLIATSYVGLQSLTQLGGLPLMLAVLLSGLLIPQLAILTRRGAWLPGLATLAGVVILVAAVARSSAASPPRLSSVLYTFDADSGERSWFSYDSEPSPWTHQLGLQAGVQGSLTRFLPRLQRPLLTSPAPESALPLPQVTVDEYIVTADLQTWILRLQAGSGARARLLWVEPATAAVSLKLVETELTLRARDDNRSQIIVELPITAPEETLIVRARGTEPVTLIVVEQHEGLPEISGLRPRPLDEIPRPFLSVVRSDVTLVRQSFELPNRSFELPN